MGIFAFVLPSAIHTSSADRRGRRPAHRGASARALRIGAPAVALLGTILLSSSAMAAPTAISLGTAAQFAILAGEVVFKAPRRTDR